MSWPRSLPAFLTCCGCLYAGSSAPDAVAVQTTAVPLDVTNPAQLRVGELSYRGGLAISSRDRRWGGLSGLVVSDDGKRLAAVSDEGVGFNARLRYDEKGWLAGIGDVEARALLDPAGRALEGKAEQDAEALTSLPDGSLIVAFERDHRIWRYGGTAPFAERPSGVPSPDGLDRAPANGGIETLVALDRDRLWALTEDLVEDGLVRGWLSESGRWSPVGYRLHGSLRPSDGARLPSGDVLVLERGYSAATGVVVRISRLAGSELAAGAALEGRTLAELRPPLTVDNFEGIAARRGEGGESLVYLVSDDNFSDKQRTLLLMFALGK